MPDVPDRIPGTAVRAARELRGWTQQQLADAIGAPTRRVVVAMEARGVPVAWRRAITQELGAELAQASTGEVSVMTGEELRERRQAAGLSREELGARIGVSGITVGGWESSRGVPARRIAALETALSGGAPIGEEPAGESEPESTTQVLARFTTAELAEEIARRAREGS
ncbi:MULTISPECIES: helix-turn-helix domain-containing protein [unclassified Pseudoclavibacter]|uniref:helix-turn-helix domain-containing protein n=1 Tax=unclassified Pseudoclavibacter TaxID=2615177 RepID=UPI001BA68ECD|nr:helix-turn-helix domain-containing protein [Pseudoclavibacter sp. Marseille-Q4354]MBS3180046.1 helix-turn-helix domain-containing protein [Pseudoclavibacter sp. Marseille-Q4354]